MLLSVIVPVYREEKNVDAFLQRITPVLEPISKNYELIFCMDPSPDRTEDVILGYRKNDPRVKLLKFSRRFGQPMAVMAGLQYSKGDAVVVIDADLQDPPELIRELVDKWREGNDVVLARRRSRGNEFWLKRLLANTWYFVMNKIAEPPIPPNTGDYRLMSRRVVNEINRLKEHHGFLRGLIAVVGFKQAFVDFDRAPRFAGDTNYNKLFGSVRIGFNGIICFSSYLLSLSSKAGFLIAFGSMVVGVIYAVMKVMGFPFPIGNPTIVILILFMGGIQLIGIGILGEYVSRIYEEVKQRPKYIVESAYGIEKK